jgi:two-component system copper resistance phosphate regulon response regulator CusR
VAAPSRERHRARVSRVAQHAAPAPHAPSLAVRALLRTVAADPALPVLVRAARPAPAARLVRDWLAGTIPRAVLDVRALDAAAQRALAASIARRDGAIGRGAMPVVVAPARGAGALDPALDRACRRCRLDLPAAGPLSATGAARPPLAHARPPASAPRPRPPRMRILVIEDDPTVGQFVKRGLEEQQFTVDLENDGEAGERRAGTGENYDVVVLDMRLPGKDGLAVLRALRARGFQRPVLVLTAQDAVDAKVQTLRAGADDYVTKPFAFEELLARIEALARRPRQMTARRLRIGDLELDLDSREVTRAGQAVELTPKEFKVLEYLMRHPGRVMSRTLITEYAWGYHFDPGTNIVDVVITHLRKKVDAGHDRKLIGTVRGVGYVIKE